MEKEKSINNSDIFSKAFNRAIGGGIAGSSAMVVQISTLMWLRTIMNHQYRYGGTTKNTIKNLYKDGGLIRFYRGYSAALLIGPLSRFGDTASNAYVLSLFEDSKLPTSVQTLTGSIIAMLWRSTMMPLDALKTTMQVEGKQGIQLLKTKVKTNGYRSLFNGNIALMSATFVGHYPWFLTYNILNEKLSKYEETHKKLLRNAFIGFNAAVISDCVSNSLRVVKTVKQTSAQNISYPNTVKYIIKNDGIIGLFGRGLKIRILTNGIQGILFTVCWKYFEEKLK